MSTLFNLAVKDLRLLLRDRVALFWVVGFPLLFAMFLGAVVHAGLSGDRAPLKVAVVDTVGSPSSQDFVRRLEDSPRLFLLRMDRESAENAVRRSEAVAYVEIGRASTASASGMSLELAVDPTREVEGSFIRRKLATTRAEMVQASPARSLESGGAVAAAADLDDGIVQASIGETVRNASDYVFPAAVLWGLIGCAACFAISMVAERARGTLLRLSAAPIDKGAILGSKALACSVSCLAVSLLLTVLAVGAFGVRIERPDKLIVALSSAVACFVGVTMLLSLLGRTEQAVAGAGWATLIVMAMLGGAMVPLSMMPDWLMPLTHLSPVKWSIVALEGALWRNFSYAELVGPCTLLVAVGGAGFGVGLRILSRAHA